MWSFVSTSVSAPASIAPVLNPTKSGLTARNLEHASLFLPLLIYHPSRDVPAYSLHCISVFLYIFQLRGVGGRSQPTLLHLSAQAKTSTFAEAMSSSLYVVILGLWAGSKCICHFHCLCICLWHCLFVGQVMFSHNPHQFCKVSVWSGRLWIQHNQWLSESVTKVGLELQGQLKTDQSWNSWRLLESNWDESMQNVKVSKFLRWVPGGPSSDLDFLSEKRVLAKSVPS